jgi:hypothetical protein
MNKEGALTRATYQLDPGSALAKARLSGMTQRAEEVL